MIAVNEVKRKKRRVASQENGKQGGVKTVEGKAISSRNATTHGILSNKENPYDKIDSNKLFSKLAKELDVETTYQEMLLEQFVLTYIKLARCSRFENEMMNEAIKTDEGEDIEDIISNQLSGKHVPEEAKAVLNELTFKKMDLVLTRYEPQLNQRMLKLLNMLRNIQKERAS